MFHSTHYILSDLSVVDAGMLLMLLKFLMLLNLLHKQNMIIQYWYI